ncbi:MAG: hypothetical protein HY000_36605 [Planctomycetes bacterium]|nr:hypothetical protein [Planctomycetota bacterium]
MRRRRSSERAMAGAMPPPAVEMSLDGLRKALAKRTKAELVDALMEIAEDDRRIVRQLESRFELHVPSKELVAATRQAIVDATDFDERDANYNFSYDYAAYETVKRNFGRLIQEGHLRAAMELSLLLMSDGSYQVEMSDEGLMSEDVEKCLKIVLKALKKCDLPPKDIVQWCDAMIKKDRVGFICDDELRALKRRFGASAST